MRVVIVGGGISGLTTAYELGRRRPDWEITVLESNDRLGGTMRTVNRDGFLFEAGSNGFLSNKPATLELVHVAGADDLLLRSTDAARKRYIHTDRLHRMPDGPKSFLTTGLLSLRGRVRTLAEVVVPADRSGRDETVRSFGNRRVGHEFTDVFLDAMSAGIFGSTPDQLSVKAAFPAVVKLEEEHGGLFRGMWAKRSREAGPGGVLMSFAGGVSRFIEHLAAQTSAEIRSGCAVTDIERMPDGYRLATSTGELECDQLVLATPAWVSADLLNTLDPELGRQLAAIDYSPIAVVGFGYDALVHPLDGFGLLTTSGSGQHVLGILWDSAIFPDRAPPGHQCLRVMIGGQRQPELATLGTQELTRIAREAVTNLMGIQHAPDTVFVKRWPRGIPNYRVGHLALVDAIFERTARHPGLWLNGNAYRGVGVNDCVANSLECARQVADAPERLSDSGQTTRSAAFLQCAHRQGMEQS